MFLLTFVSAQKITILLPILKRSRIKLNRGVSRAREKEGQKKTPSAINDQPQPTLSPIPRNQPYWSWKQNDINIFFLFSYTYLSLGNVFYFIFVFIRSAGTLARVMHETDQWFC